jgi:4-hydroxy-tetrahydrodipicolinate reductase
MLNITISGVTGRMGQALTRLIAEAEDLRLVGGIAAGARSGNDARRLGCEHIEAIDDAARALEGADVCIDVSSAAALGALVAEHAAALRGRALVIGTTGFDDATLRVLAELASDSPVLVAANFSIGVHVLARLVEDAARLLGGDTFDVEIVEAHHRRKADAPSGTALLLAEAVAKARGVPLEEVRRDGRSGRTGERSTGEIGLHALRGGGVVGEHRVLLLGERERVELFHSALDRSVFAAGALHAARWLAGRAPGRYTMRDVIGL